MMKTNNTPKTKKTNSTHLFDGLIGQTIDNRFKVGQYIQSGI